MSANGPEPAFLHYYSAHRSDGQTDEQTENKHGEVVITILYHSKGQPA